MGLSCALQDGQQPLWPLPTGCQEQPPPRWDKVVSRHCHMFPGGKVAPPCLEPLSWKPGYLKERMEVGPD